MMNMETYLANSARIQTDDLDWDAARAVGLTDDERFILTYFSDIELQTFVYMRMLINMKISLKPDVMGFLTVWNYEEFFHGRILARLLSECGFQLEEDRVAKVNSNSRFFERFEATFTPLVSKIFSKQFPAVYLSFGAIQELTTLRGYERLRESTKNPVLQILCDRIARQERKHFAWYYNKALEELEKSGGARFLTRLIMKHHWTPVGAGVKNPQEVFKLFTILFPGEAGRDLLDDVDEKISLLPGLKGMALMGNYFNKAQKIFPNLVPSDEIQFRQRPSQDSQNTLEDSWP
jgi:hypothetical protein